MISVLARGIVKHACTDRRGSKSRFKVRVKVRVRVRVSRRGSKSRVEKASRANGIDSMGGSARKRT